MKPPRKEMDNSQFTPLLAARIAILVPLIRDQLEIARHWRETGHEITGCNGIANLASKETAR